MFLQRFGQQATIIDKALSFEKLGYVLSLKSFGLKLMAELGLIEELDKRLLKFDSLRFCRANGRLIQEYSQKMAQAMAHGAALIYRAELQEILYDTVRKTLPVRFGVRIASVEQSEADIEITFSNGEREVYDVVIIAEGLRSTTSQALWKSDGIQPFDILYAAASVDRLHGLDIRSIHAYIGSGNAIIFLPVSECRLIIQSYFRGEMADRYPKTQLVEIFGDFSTQVLKLLEAMNAERVRLLRFRCDSVIAQAV